MEAAKIADLSGGINNLASVDRMPVKHARDLLTAGANMVIPETVEAGLQLSAFVLEALGVPETTVVHVLDRERTRRVADLNNGAVT